MDQDSNNIQAPNNNNFIITENQRNLIIDQNRLNYYELFAYKIFLYWKMHEKLST
jgi:hypothetical protein